MKSSVKDIPGVKVVWQKGFLGVVAPREWDAIRASRKTQGHLVGCEAAVPETRANSTITSARLRS